MSDRLQPGTSPSPLEPAGERSFLERLDDACALAERTGEVFAVHCFELCGTQPFAEVLGPEVARRVFERLAIMIRRADTLSSTGNGQFALLQRNVKSTMGAITLIQKILDELSAPFMIRGQSVETKVAMGTTFHVPGAGAAALFAQAREALARAKERAGSAYRFHSRDLEREVEATVALHAELRAAIERHELFLEYQPQVDLATETVVAYEALVRWRHPRRGRLEPSEFIPLAEETGEIAALGWAVLVEACRQCQEWNSRAREHVRVAVNVSAVQLQDARFSRRVDGLLAETALKPSLLELEVTETALFRDERLVRQALAELSEIGVGLAIDDFGTGYSSLRHLRSLPVQRIKIAQEFVQGVVEDPNDAAIVAAVVALGEKLGLQTLAEGVETEDQAAFLRQERCAAAQGYFFGPPRSAPSHPAPAADFPRKEQPEQR